MTNTVKGLKVEIDEIINDIKNLKKKYEDIENALTIEAVAIRERDDIKYALTLGEIKTVRNIVKDLGELLI